MPTMGFLSPSPLAVRRGGESILNPPLGQSIRANILSPSSPGPRTFPEDHTMGFKQTATHRNGKGSFHQIGLVRGQFGNVPEADWIKFIAASGFDGWEEASWELDLRQCDTDAGAASFARQRVDMAKKNGLEIFTVATHLQGQCLGDEPSAKTLNFCNPKGEARGAYKAWRAAGNNPPRTDPYFVPPEVGKLIHQESLRDLMACARYAHHLSKLQDRKVAL